MEYFVIVRRPKRQTVSKIGGGVHFGYGDEKTRVNEKRTFAGIWKISEVGRVKVPPGVRTGTFADKNEFSSKTSWWRWRVMWIDRLYLEVPTRANKRAWIPYKCSHGLFSSHVFHSPFRFIRQACSAYIAQKTLFNFHPSTNGNAPRPRICRPKWPCPI